MHFLVQLCEPGHILGLALPVLDGGCIPPGFGELFKAGRRQTRRVSRSLCLGHEGFPRVANSTAPLFWEGGGDLWRAYLIEIDGAKMRGWFG